MPVPISPIALLLLAANHQLGFSQAIALEPDQTDSDCLNGTQLGDRNWHQSYHSLDEASLRQIERIGAGYSC